MCLTGPLYNWLEVEAHGKLLRRFMAKFRAPEKIWSSLCSSSVIHEHQVNRAIFLLSLGVVPELRLVGHELLGRFDFSGVSEEITLEETGASRRRNHFQVFGHAVHQGNSGGNFHVSNVFVADAVDHFHDAADRVAVSRHQDRFPALQSRHNGAVVVRQGALDRVFEALRQGHVAFGNVRVPVVVAAVVRRLLVNRRRGRGERPAPLFHLWGKGVQEEKNNDVKQLKCATSEARIFGNKKLRITY